MADEEFSAATEAAMIGEEVIAQHMPLLLGVPILYLLSGKEVKKNGKRVLGTARRLSGITKYLTRGTFDAREVEAEFSIVLDGLAWMTELSPERKRALVHHELMHCQVSFDDEGTPKYSIKAHDFEGFVEELKLYGPWTIDFKVMADQVQQLPMNFGIGVGLPDGPAAAGAWHDGPVDGPHRDVRGTALLGEELDWNDPPDNENDDTADD